MAGPILADSDYGSPTYVDDTHNWRAQDVAYIQKRSVLRFPTQAALEAHPHDEPGAVAYVAVDADADDTIEPGAEPYFTGHTGNGWRRLVHSQFLRIPDTTDTASSVRLRHDSASSGLSLRSTGAVVAESRLEVGSEQVVIDAGVISLKNGVNTRTIQVDGTGKLTLSGTVVTTALETGALTASTLSASGAVTTGALSVVGTVTATGAVTAPSATITTLNSTTMNASIHAATSVRLTSTGINRADGSAAVVVGANSLAAFAPDGFSFRRSLSETAAQVACVVTSTSAPSGTYPEGTIWLQVP